MLCPVCQVDPQMSERHGVEIDYCPKCRGAGLDRGELDKFIKRPTEHEDRSTYASPAPQRRESCREYDDDRHHKKKRGAFLSDLFDF
ncbi:MAG: zf-TFIIB domain-containing protein [Chloroflexota bacterium]